MIAKWRTTLLACLMVLVLVGTMFLGCGGAGDRQGHVITIGLMTDITGPAGVPCEPYGWAVRDMVRYINEEDPIPGATLKVVTYDTRYDPARDLPGYEYLKARGASIIWTPLPPTAESLQPFAARDRIPVLIQQASESALTPASWTFAWSPPPNRVMPPLLKHLADEWTGSYPIKVASVGWEDPYQNDVIAGMRDYAATDDRVEFIGGFTPPFGTLSWSSEIVRTMNADFISLPTTGLALPTFVEQSRGAGYKGEFICTDAIGGSVQLLVQKSGWGAIDGMLTAWGTLYWTEDIEKITRAKWTLENYRGTAELAKQRQEGSGYSCVFASGTLWLDILREAVNRVGAENFNGQAFYDTAISYTGSPLEGYPELTYVGDQRWPLRHVALYEWSAAKEDLVRIGDWIPLI